MLSHAGNLLRRGHGIKHYASTAFSPDKPPQYLVQMPNQPKWLITACASDGVEGPATVEIPGLGPVTLQARAIGSVYTATLQDGKPVLRQVDAE